MLALGVVWHEFSYLRTSWHRLDCVIVLSGLLSHALAQLQVILSYQRDSCCRLTLSGGGSRC